MSCQAVCKTSWGASFPRVQSYEVDSFVEQQLLHQDSSRPSLHSFCKMDSGTCAAPDGSTKVWSISPRLATLIVSVIGFGPLLAYLLIPKLLFLLGGWTGNRLKGRTADRRKQILELREVEEDEWRRVNGKKGKRESEDWEKVDGPTAGGVVEGKLQDFDGVIGFFHPFW